MGRRKKRRDARRRARIAALNAATNQLAQVPPALAPTLTQMSAANPSRQASCDASTEEDCSVPSGDLSMAAVIAHLRRLTDAAMHNNT
ncbi:hypothetical protein FJY94_02925 [Candidatus Kaiserbacteria bacterium]|nr:hypothetical protein [Candidatus Kaiserbacteria bacterium]